MSEQKEPKAPVRISFPGARGTKISFPPPDRGTFKLSVNEHGETTATPLKDGKLMTSPSHTYSNVSNKWVKLQSPPQSMSEKIAWDVTPKSKSNEFNSKDTDPRNIARETLAAASVSRRTAYVMKNSDNEQRELFKDEQSHNKTKISSEISLDIDNPYLMGIELSTKLGQSMCVQASKGLPSADKFDLSQKGARRFLKDLIRASNSYY